MKTAHLAPIAAIAAVLCLCEPGSSIPVRVKRQGKPDCDGDKDCGPHARCVTIHEIATCACENGYTVRETTHCTEAHTSRKTSVESVPSTPTIPTVPSSPPSTKANEGQNPSNSSLVPKTTHFPSTITNATIGSTSPLSPGGIKSTKALEGHNTSSTLSSSTTTTVKVGTTSPTSQGGVNVTKGTNKVISECSTDAACGLHGLCVNVLGRGICACQLGYTREQLQCTEVKEASTIAWAKWTTARGVNNRWDNVYEEKYYNNENGENEVGETFGPSNPESTQVHDETPLSSHIMAYAVTVIVVAIILYLAYQNKAKVIQFVLQGRNEMSRRRAPGGGPEYRKISNVEESLPNTGQGGLHAERHLLITAPDDHFVCHISFQYDCNNHLCKTVSEQQNNG